MLLCSTLRDSHLEWFSKESESMLMSFHWWLCLPPRLRTSVRLFERIPRFLYLGNSHLRGSIESTLMGASRATMAVPASSFETWNSSWWPREGVTFLLRWFQLQSSEKSGRVCSMLRGFFGQSISFLRRILLRSSLGYRRLLGLPLCIPFCGTLHFFYMAALSSL